MDVTSLIVIVAIIVVIFIFIKFIVSPIIKVIVGIITFLLLIYVLQRFFGFDLTRIFGPFGSYLDLTKWGINFNWLLEPINYCIEKIEYFFHYAWGNVPK